MHTLRALVNFVILIGALVSGVPAQSVEPREMMMTGLTVFGNLRKSALAYEDLTVGLAATPEETSSLTVFVPVTGPGSRPARVRT